MEKLHIILLLVLIFACILVVLIIYSPYLFGHVIGKVSDEGEEVESIRIYIYDWPSNLTDCWPNSFNHHRLSFEEHFQKNNFEGNLINQEKSLFHTHQYSLYQLLIARLKISPYVTTDPEKATHFFIPYDIGMCSTTRKEDGALTATKCPQLSAISKLLEQSKYFKRSGGADHILIHSINHMMLHFLNADCQSLYKQCLNCMKFSIDYYTQQLYPELKTLPHLTRNWISVPFPSNFHALESKSASLPWNLTSLIAGNRSHRFCLIANTEVTSKKQKALRKKLFEFCNKFSKDCYSIQLSSHSSNVLYFNSSNSSSSTSSSSSLLSSPYEQCQFCFTPGGDFPTRKAFFDALLSGCIPIIFQLESAHLQWPYHWINRANAYNSVLYYSRERFMTSSLDANHQLLMKYYESPNYIKLKLETIADIAHRFQYSHLPSTLSEDISLNEDAKKEKRIKGFKPKNKDAFEVIIDILRMKATLE